LSRPNLAPTDITLFDNGALLARPRQRRRLGTSITLSGDGGHNITRGATDLPGNTAQQN